MRNPALTLLLLLLAAPALTPAQTTTDSYRERARRLLAAGQFEEAEQMAASALAQNRTDPVALNLLAQIRYAQKRWEEAIELFTSAWQLRPGEASLPTSIGICQFELQRLQDATMSFREALRVDQSRYLPHLYLGRIARAEGDVAAAERELRAAVEKGADDPLPSYYLGLLLFRQDRLDEAAAAFEAALTRQPDLPSAHLNLGLVLIRLGQAAEGRGHLERFAASTEAATRDQQKALRATSRLQAAREDLEAGRSESALALALEAQQIAPDAVAVHIMLSMIYQRLGRLEESRAAAVEAQRLQQAAGGP